MRGRVAVVGLVMLLFHLLTLIEFVYSRLGSLLRAALLSRPDLFAEQKEQTDADKGEAGESANDDTRNDTARQTAAAGVASPGAGAGCEGRCRGY